MNRRCFLDGRSGLTIKKRIAEEGHTVVQGFFAPRNERHVEMAFFMTEANPCHFSLGSGRAEIMEARLPVIGQFTAYYDRIIAIFHLFEQLRKMIVEIIPRNSIFRSNFDDADVVHEAILAYS